MPTRILFDVEANGLLEAEGDKPAATTAWCVSAVDIDTREERFFGPDELEDALRYIATADVLAGHNIQRYDLPLLKKLYWWWRPKTSAVIRDTMIIARLKHPNVKDTDTALIQQGKMPAGKGYHGKHTIGAWGYRLGKPKLHEDITDWSVWTAEMGERCVGDMRTNLLLWEHLRPDDYSQDAVVLEHRIAHVCDLMQKAGVPFNQKLAGALHADLVERKDTLEKALVAQFGAWLAPISPDPHKYEVTPKVNRPKDGICKSVPYCKCKWVTFNPGSRAHIARVLSKKGWTPLKKHASGNPEIDEAEIERIVKLYPEMDGLAEYLMISKRISQLAGGDQSLLNHVAADGRIHGVCSPMGTTTSRASHFYPNLAQVPSEKKPYGHRFRELFEAPAGWVMVGADMEGLEGRGFAHYMHLVDNGAYADALLKGDPHWASAKALTFVGQDEVRDKANQLHVILREGSKRFYYAFIYGAWELQCGSIIQDTVIDARKAGFPEPYRQFFGKTEAPSEKLLKTVGRKARDRFTKGVPGMEKLLAKLERQIEIHGWLPGIDKRRIPVRSSHSALNFIIQSCGAILCKRWGCDAFDECCNKYRWGWDGDFVFSLWIHDEFQAYCRKKIAEEIGAILIKHAKAAGEPYGFRVPLDSKYSVGRSWADTH